MGKSNVRLVIIFRLHIFDIHIHEYAMALYPQHSTYLCCMGHKTVHSSNKLIYIKELIQVATIFLGLEEVPHRQLACTHDYKLERMKVEKGKKATKAKEQTKSSFSSWRRKKVIETKKRLETEKLQRERER